jgi:hypothetical protein
MPLFDVFWAMLWFFMWIVWFWLLITVFSDIFRSEDLSGSGKAAWVAFTVLLPYLGVFVYLIARGSSMHERSRRMAEESDRATREYIKSAASAPSATDELAKLAELHDTGALSDQEYERQKSKVLAS